MNAAQLRTLVTDALLAKTDAQERVYSPRDWPTSENFYPALLIQTPVEVKRSHGRNLPQFTTVTTVQITGRVQALDEEKTNNGAMKAESALECLREQIERAVINSFDLTRQIQQFAQVRSAIGVSASGEGHTAELVMELDIEYYQGPEDFYPPDTEPLEGINVTATMPDCTTAPRLTIELE